MRLSIQLARFMAISSLSIALIACGSSDDNDDDDGGGDGGALTSINGTYRSDCIATSAFASNRVTYVALDGELTVTNTSYVDNNCTVPILSEISTADYVLGGSVRLDGSTAGITAATEIDATKTTAGDPEFGITSYEIVALLDELAYVSEADGENDGTTPARRHMRLDGDFVLTRQ